MKKIIISILFMIFISTTISATDMQSITTMTYRNNDVLFTSTDDIVINGGSFVANDFNITEGQDTDNVNFIGKRYSLSNNTLTFVAGRKASADVATWFNFRFSGYNDESINGDRTTFSQNANTLNFAFKGDLSLYITSEDYPSGELIVFHDVGIAQGSTGVRNNWWFAQEKGQHTKSSDDEYTLLTFGTDSSGNEVYASFLRGNNAVNEISLQAVYKVQPKREDPVYLTDVVDAFNSLPITGDVKVLKNFPGYYDPTINHVQGYSQYEHQNGSNYSVVTHSVLTAPYGHIIIGENNGSKQFGFKSYLKDWTHPGGIQTIGDYLLVPSELDGVATISLYDLRSLAVNELRRVETFELSVQHKVGSLAITSYTAKDGIAYYLLIAAELEGTNSIYHAYQSPVSLGIENAQFIHSGSFHFDKDFQGFGLITESITNNVYLIGLLSTTEAATFADYAYLHSINTETWTISSALSTKHMISQGGYSGIMGVHFRYGAGVLVTKDQKLQISATERNTILGRSLVTNNWIN